MWSCTVSSKEICSHAIQEGKQRYLGFGWRNLSGRRLSIAPPARRFQRLLRGTTSATSNRNTRISTGECSQCRARALLIKNCAVHSVTSDHACLEDSIQLPTAHNLFEITACWSAGSDCRARETRVALHQGSLKPAGVSRGRCCRIWATSQNELRAFTGCAAQCHVLHCQ